MTDPDEPAAAARDGGPGFVDHPVFGHARGYLLLVGASVYALVSAGAGLVAAALAREGGTQPALAALDQLLVALIFVELFYTVRLSILEHTLAVEPFIAVALIATVRRILVLTAEEQRVVEGSPETFQRLLLELGLLAVLILVLAGAMLLLRRATPTERRNQTGA